MEAQEPAPRFVRQWVLASVLLAVAVGGFNALVDPYLLFNSPRVEGLNDRKPAVETEERLMKAYQVTRTRPRGLILGTSRVDMGLDTRHPAWPADAQPVYNLGIAAASPYTSFRYLQHATATGDPELVILGLDFEYFLSAGQARDGTAEFEARLAVNRGGAANDGRRLQYARDLFRGTLSLDALLDSVDTLRANLRPDSANLAPTGDLSEASLRRDAVELGSWSLFSQRDLQNIRLYYGKTKNDAGLADVEQIIELCRDRGARLVMLINPVHADMLETFDRLGLWDDFESWKRQLVTLATAESSAAWGVELWDFSGYDAYSTESVPSSGNVVLQWFWEPSHYTKALGDKIVGRMFGGGSADFGALLTPATIEARIADVRAARHAYRSSNPRDVQRVQEIFAQSVGAGASATAASQ